MSRTAKGPVLCAYRPNGGLLAMSVRDFDHAVEVWRSMQALYEPSLLASVTWWITPDSNPVFAGSEVMAAEQEKAKAEKEAAGGK